MSIILTDELAASLLEVLTKAALSDTKGSPMVLTMSNMLAMDGFDKLIKAAAVPEPTKRYREQKKVKVHLNQHIAINKVMAMNYIHGIEGAEEAFNSAVKEAIKARPAHIRRPGKDGTWCKGRLGYINPVEAGYYLAGKISEITVHRAQSDSLIMPTYFEMKPNNYLGENSPIEVE